MTSSETPKTDQDSSAQLPDGSFSTDTGPVATSGANVVDVEAQFRIWFEAALRKHAGDETFTWAAGVMQVPTPSNGVNGEFSWVSIIALFVSTPGQLVRTALDNHAQVSLHGLTEEIVDRMTGEIVASLRESRRRQPEEMAKSEQQAAQNGRMPPASGLILPG